MRQVYIRALDRSVAPLGFGCASLGSRVSAARGRRAFDAAFDGGVRWFDTAPPYGDGESETLLGRFIRGRRDQLVLVTKYGIARPHIPLAKRLLRPLARAVVAHAPGLRTRVSRARPIGERAPIDPAGLSPSLDESLRRLGTDHVDILALHEPSVADVTSPRLIEALLAERERGRIRAIGIAGEADVILAAAQAGLPVDIAQFAETPFAPVAALLRNRLPATSLPDFVIHSILGSGNLDRFAALLPAAERARAAEQLLEYAFAANPNAIVLASMYSPGHIAANLALAARQPNPAHAAALAELCRTE